MVARAITHRLSVHTALAVDPCLILDSHIGISLHLPPQRDPVFGLLEHLHTTTPRNTHTHTDSHSQNSLKNKTVTSVATGTHKTVNSYF